MSNPTTPVKSSPFTFVSPASGGPRLRIGAPSPSKFRSHTVIGGSSGRSSATPSPSFNRESAPPELRSQRALSADVKPVISRAGSVVGSDSGTSVIVPLQRGPSPSIAPSESISVAAQRRRRSTSVMSTLSRASRRSVPYSRTARQLAPAFQAVNDNSLDVQLVADDDEITMMFDEPEGTMIGTAIAGPSGKGLPARSPAGGAATKRGQASTTVNVATRAQPVEDHYPVMQAGMDIMSFLNDFRQDERAAVLATNRGFQDVDEYIDTVSNLVQNLHAHPEVCEQTHDPRVTRKRQVQRRAL